MQKGSGMGMSSVGGALPTVLVRDRIQAMATKIGAGHAMSSGARYTQTMPQYRRAKVPGACVFLTMVTQHRRPLFGDAANVVRLRRVLAQVMRHRPMRVDGAVVLPDHIHFLWQLPADDANYSDRVGQLKALFTRNLGATRSKTFISESRRKHREADVWQRRFWEHTIRDEDDWRQHLDYIHYNPVHHRLVQCPHQWEYSSFGRWVNRGGYRLNWCCRCEQRDMVIPSFERVGGAGE